MSSFAMVKLQLRALELKLGVKRGGFLFWLFVFNCLASLVLLLFFGFVIHWALGIVVFVFCIWVLKCFNVTSYWNGMVE